MKNRILVAFMLPVFLIFDTGNIETVECETVYIAGSQPTSEVRTISREDLNRPVTEDEYELLLRVCMSETGGIYGEPMEGKIAVVETILNRVDLGYGSISEVVHSAYSTHNNGQPDDSCRQAVDSALSGNMYPDNMLYFRTGHYHDFGIPYAKIGNHYFSLSN